MNWRHEKIIKCRDGSYIIQHKGKPYPVQIEREEGSALWDEVHEHAINNSNMVVEEEKSYTEEEATLLMFLLLKMELKAIDDSSARSMRAILTNRATTLDRAELVKKQERADVIREELARVKKKLKLSSKETG